MQEREEKKFSSEYRDSKENREKIIWDKCGHDTCLQTRSYRHAGSRGNKKIITMKFRNSVERITSRGVAAFISCATSLIKGVNCSKRHAEKTA